MKRPYFTHDNMGAEYEVLGHFSGEVLTTGVHRVREIGQLKKSRRYIDSNGCVGPALNIIQRLAYHCRK